MYTYAFIIHVTEYERMKIKIPVEGSFEFVSTSYLLYA